MRLVVRRASSRSSGLSGQGADLRGAGGFCCGLRLDRLLHRRQCRRGLARPPIRELYPERGPVGGPPSRAASATLPPLPPGWARAVPPPTAHPPRLGRPPHTPL